MGHTRRHDALLDLPAHGEVTAQPQATVAIKATVLSLRNSPPAQHRFARALVTIGLAGLIAVGVAPANGKADASLPELGDASAVVMPPQEEARIGADFMRQARRALPLIEDPILQDYVERLGARLLDGNPDAGRYHFFIVDDPQINAFAVPGGYIGLNSGVLLQAKSEHEVAGVLAHEVAHIEQRHIPRLMAASRISSAAAMAGLLAGIVAAASGAGHADAAIALSTAAYAENQLRFTREFEQEADRVGLDLLQRAGFDPRGMPDFFEKLQAWSRLNDVDAPEFLRTHPLSTSRISDTRARAESLPRAPAKGSEFAEMQMRLRVLTGKNPAALADALGKELEAAPTLPLRYGLALAQLQQRRLGDAQTQLHALARARPGYLLDGLLQAELNIKRSDTRAALTIFRHARRAHPDNSLVKTLYADALIQAHDFRAAHALLRELVRERPQDPSLFRRLADVENRLGSRYGMHRALAESAYLSGDTRGALQQLALAKQHAGAGFYQNASTDARMQEIKDELARTGRDVRQKP